MALERGRAAAVAAGLGLAAAWGCAPRGFVCPGRGGPPWREVTSEHYRLYTDLDSAGGRTLSWNLEAIRSRLLAAMAAQPPPHEAEPLEVVAFARAAELKELRPDVQGFYSRDGFGRRFIFLDGSTGADNRRLVAHELAHYLSSYAIRRQPRWFAEGLARFLETVGQTPPGEPARVGAPLEGATLRGLRALLRPSAELLRWKRVEEPRREQALYATAWVLVHYLNDREPERFTKLQMRLSLGEEPEAAFAAVFPEWAPSTPGASGRLDQELGAFVAANRFLSRLVQGGLPPAGSIAERPLAPAEVHGLRLRLPRAWDPAALRAEEEEALAEDPGHVQALAWRARRDAFNAPALARRAVAAHPEDARAWLLLGSALPEEEEQAEREAALRRAVALAPGLLEARIALAELLLDEARFDEAETVAYGAASAAPWSFRALLAEGAALAALGDCPGAIASVRRGLESVAEGFSDEQRERVEAGLEQTERRCAGGKAAGVVKLLAEAARALRRQEPEEAVVLLREAHALDPASPDAAEQLAEGLLAVGEADEAAEVLRARAEGDPKAAQALTRRGTALSLAGREAEAELAWRSALSTGRELPAPRLQLGELLWRTGRPAEVPELIAPLLKKTPGDAAALRLRAKALFALGRRAEALADLERVQSAGSGPQALNNLAWALAEAGEELERAGAWAQAAVAGSAEALRRIASAPGATEAVATRALASHWDTLAAVRLGQGRAEEAAHLARAAVSLWSAPGLWETLGRAEQAAGRAEDAARAFATAAAQPWAPPSARRRLASVAGEERAPTLLEEARARLQAQRRLWDGPPASAQAQDLLLRVGATGLVEEVRAPDGSQPPLAGLVGRKLFDPLPVGAPPAVFLRARARCTPAGCSVERIDGRPARVPGPPRA